MPDRFGKPLRYGDKVVYDSPKYGLVTGVLAANEEDHETLRVKRDSDNQLQYINKLWRKSYSQVMNLTAWFQEELDKGDLPLIH